MSAESTLLQGVSPCGKYFSSINRTPGTVLGRREIPVLNQTKQNKTKICLRGTFPSCEENHAGDCITHQQLPHMVQKKQTRVGAWGIHGAREAGGVRAFARDEVVPCVGAEEEDFRAGSVKTAFLMCSQDGAGGRGKGTAGEREAWRLKGWHRAHP